MRKLLSTFKTYSLASLLALVLSTSFAHAQTSVITNVALGVFNNFVASIFQLVLYIMHYWVVITAALFSISINLNLHIKQFVDTTEGVYTVWQTIRDVCSIFIIFMLLYTAIRLILSSEENGLESVGNLIKNIIIAGILINFSFFITSLLIDASNMVSLAIYKGIVGTDSSLSTNLSVSSMTKDILNPASTKETSLGDFFMAKLSPQTVYDIKLSDPTATTVSAPLKILLQGAVGTVIMFTVGLSFILASIAFAARLVILVMLLAFSSVWFASTIFPSLKSKSDEFWGYLKSQLIFMPVYLLLLYAALVVLNKSTIFNSPSSVDSQGQNWIYGYVVLAINDFFIIFLLNLPLVTALSFAGSSMKWLDASKLNANAIWKNIGGRFGNAGKNLGNFAQRNTVGYAASRFNNSAAMKQFAANNPTLGKYISGQVNKASKGYDKYQKEQAEAAKKFGEQLGKVERSRYKSDEEFKAAKAEAEKAQKRYSENLTSPAGANIYTRMFRARGAEQAGHDMQDKAKKKEQTEKDKKDLKEAREGRSQLDGNHKAALTTIENKKAGHDKELTDIETKSKEATAELDKLSTELDSIERINRVSASQTSTKDTEQKIAEVKAKISDLQKQKLQVEEFKKQTDTEKAAAIEHYEKEKQRFQDIIDTIKEKREDKLQSSFDKAEENAEKKPESGSKKEGEGEKK